MQLVDGLKKIAGRDVLLRPLDLPPGVGILEHAEGPDDLAVRVRDVGWIDGKVPAVEVAILGRNSHRGGSQEKKHEEQFRPDAENPLPPLFQFRLESRCRCLGLR